MATSSITRCLFPKPNETQAPKRQRSIRSNDRMKQLTEQLRLGIVNVTEQLRLGIVNEMSTLEKFRINKTVTILYHKNIEIGNDRLANELFRAAVAAGLDMSHIA